MRRLAIPVLAALLVVGLVAAPAAADKPTPISYPEEVTDTNPCTGEEFTAYLTFEGYEHHHKNNYVRTGTLTGSTTDGYFSDNGREKLVVGQRTATLTFHSTWSNDEGSKYKVNGVFVTHLDTGDGHWDINARCIRY
jgi:hypothetical protein